MPTHVVQGDAGLPVAMGTATLVLGTVTVSTSDVVTNSRIIASRITPGGVMGQLSVPAAGIVNGVSFDINSSSLLDASTVRWIMWGPA